MMQYEGFEAKGKEEYSKLVSFIIDHGYQGITSDHYVFVKNFWIKISLYSVGFWLIFSLGLKWAEDENREPCVGLTHQGRGLGAKAPIFILVCFCLMSKRQILETLASSLIYSAGSKPHNSLCLSSLLLVLFIYFLVPDLVDFIILLVSKLV